MSNQTEILLWLDSPITKELIKILSENLEADKETLSQGFTLKPGSTEIETAKIVGRIEVLNLVANHLKEMLGVRDIEDEPL